MYFLSLNGCFKCFIHNISLEMFCIRSRSSRYIQMHLSKEISARFSSSEEITLGDVLKQYFDISIPTKMQNRIISSNHKILVEKNCRQLLEFKVPVTSGTALIKCVLHQNNLLEHKIRLIRELNLGEITTQCLANICSQMRCSLQLFKKKKGVSENKTLFFNVLEKVSDQIVESIERPYEEQIDHMNNVGDLYKTCMSYHITRNLELPVKVADFIVKKPKYCSFEMIKETIEILKNLNGFNIEEHPVILMASPKNIRDILNYVQNSEPNNSSSLMRLIIKKPRILLYDAEKVQEVIMTLNEYGVSVEGIVSRYSLLTRLDKMHFVQKLEYLKNRPKTWVYRRCPSFLNLLDSDTNVSNGSLALADLVYNDSNKESLPADIYLPNQTRLQELVMGLMKAQKRKKILKYVLETELDEYAEDAAQLLLKHPQVNRIGFTTICDTIKYLKEYYSLKEISANAQILLFSRSIVAKMLKIVHEDYSPEKGYNFTKTQELTLCHYLLERTTGFDRDAPLYTDVELELCDSNELGC